MQFGDVSGGIFSDEVVTSNSSVSSSSEASNQHVRFLRRIPLDPITGTLDWGLRSLQDDPNAMSWGYMIGAARTVIRSAWWLSFFPGIAIVITVLALNLIGEGLNDALNPHLSRKGKA